jgi:hypothetical protein
VKRTQKEPGTLPKGNKKLASTAPALISTETWLWLCKAQGKIGHPFQAGYMVSFARIPGFCAFETQSSDVLEVPEPDTMGLDS